MLSPAGAMEPVADAAVTARIPMVELPISHEELTGLIGSLDGVLVTHTHRDHWDQAAVELLPRSIPIVCQLSDQVRIADAEFREIEAVEGEVLIGGVRVIRTGGRHGVGELGQRLGPVSGFVLDAPDEPRLYIAGDTVWCPEVADALSRHRPHVVVVNAGAAQFRTGGPITMDVPDVLEVTRAAPVAQVVAVHFETINHCLLRRADLRAAVDRDGVGARVRVPADGDTLAFDRKS